MEDTLENTDLVIKTRYGRLHKGDAFELLKGNKFKHRKNKTDLIFTSPPFPLNRKKKYGNLNGENYLEWIRDLADLLPAYLSETGSIVIEMGNSWEKGSPTMSTLPMEALLEFKRSSGLHLCQEFIMHNPARLPGPIEWVNKKRCRVKDTFSRFWWLSKTPFPKADNRNVLVEYSTKMKKLLETQTYNGGKRPSQHDIGAKSFSTNHGGAIPSNVITASNTSSNDAYLRYCRSNELTPHPARMPEMVVEFFIKLLTSENDLVFDPFAGSATTCAVSERLKRRWWATEVDKDYVTSAKGRFI